VAITEDTSNQPAAVHAGGTSGTTGSFTPPASRLLAALVAVDGNSGTATTVTVSDTASGAWQLLRRTNSSAAGLGGSAEVWIRDCITSPGAITVTASWAGGGGAAGGNLVVRTLIGAAPVASQTGATGGASGVPGTVAASVTPNTLGSRIYGAALDYTSAITMTVNANTTSIDQFVDTTNGDTWAAFKASADTASLSATSYGYSTSASFNLAAAEILPATGGGASGSWLAQAPTRRRLAVRPLRARVSTPVRPQADTPLPAGTVVDPPRRLRGLLARRARVVSPVPAQVVVTAPAYPPAPERARLKGVRLFRPRVATPVPAQVIVTAPAYPPAPERPRLKGLRLFRPRAAAPVPAQVVFVAAAYPPQSVRTRLKGLRLFRGHAVAPVPPQVVVVPASYVPAAVRGRLKLPALRRHDNVQPFIDQALPPQMDPRPRPKFRPVRGRVVLPPAPQPQPVVPLLTRLKLRLVKAVRGRPTSVVPPQVILIAPPRVAQATRARRNQFAARRHRGGVDGWMVPGIHICVITRPNTGITADPAGLIVRPDTGVVINEC
jgi:hypothetical protein